MANSILKSNILGSQNLLWASDVSLRNGRFPHSRLHLRPHRFHPLSLFLSHRRSILVHSAPFSALFRRRVPSLVSIMSSFSSVKSSQDKNAPAAPTTKTVRVMIKGRVQGVFYRNWTIDNAQELRLKGWVRNRRDGSVEALFSGNPEKVDEMEQRCRRGPPAAMVTGLQVLPSTEDPGSTFELRPTI